MGWRELCSIKRAKNKQAPFGKIIRQNTNVGVFFEWPMVILHVYREQLWSYGLCLLLVNFNLMIHASIANVTTLLSCMNHQQITLLFKTIYSCKPPDTLLFNCTKKLSPKLHLLNRLDREMEGPFMISK